MSSPLLSVRDLRVIFDTGQGDLTAVDGVSFDVPPSSTVALVGESGCGKTVTAHSIMRLLPTTAHIRSGQVELDGVNLLAASERQMRRVRGADIGIVFQDPMSSLNPVYSVGAQIVEAIRVHQTVSRSKARARAIELLERVGFPAPAERFDDYPHEMSGGMRQRVMIAIALSCSPKLLIADEPTTALDMLASAQITALLLDLRRERDLSLLLISHDIGLVAESADHVVVLYAGQVVEQGPAESVLHEPLHPYTRALLSSVPPLRKTRRRRRKTPTRLPAIVGSVPDPRHLPHGCRFSDRCPEVMDRCTESAPELIERHDQSARCFLLEGAEQ